MQETSLQNPCVFPTTEVFYDLTCPCHSRSAVNILLTLVLHPTENRLEGMAGKSVLPPPYLPPIEDEEYIIFHDTAADKFILHSSSVARSPEFDIFQVRTSTFLRFCMWCIQCGLFPMLLTLSEQMLEAKG
jgi:hypothetical protein